MTIRYGEPLHPTPQDDIVEVTAELQRRVAALLDEAQRDYPDGAPAGQWWVPARLGGGAPTPEVADAYLHGLAERWTAPRPRTPARKRRRAS